jgi:hypothetical protein
VRGNVVTSVIGPGAVIEVPNDAVAGGDDGVTIAGR